MKKKIALLLSILSVVMLLAACTTEDPTKVNYNGKSYEELHETSTTLATALKGLSVEDIEKRMEDLKKQDEEAAEVQIGLCEKWIAAMEVSGNYVDIKEETFVIEKSGKTVTTDVTLQFENREVTFQLVYNYHDMEMTGVTIEPVYSLGEKMTKAALNTAICMSIVFAVLIFISCLISCFRIFPYLEAKKNEKAKKAQPVIEEAAPVTENVQEEDDTELVAVIAAAIAAYEGSSTSDFVVRSIRRR